MYTTTNPGTRERLLEVACQLFADKGYSATSVAEITSLAGANKAAVNYHFRSKENLYQQAWRHAHDELVRRIPPDGGVAHDKSPEELLRGRIRAALQRAMFGDGIEMRIMRNEMTNPTGLLRQVIDDAIGPIREATQALLRELLGPKASDTDIALCEVCVVAPWMHVMHHRQAQKHEGLAPVFNEDMLDPMVDHFTAYALAGIRQTRRRIASSDDKRQPSRPNRQRKASTR